VRRRIRVREYAGAIDTAETPVFTSGCFLELKESTGTVREKKRRPITIPEIEQMMADSALQPCLSTWYRRVTLEDASREIRITMDEGVAYGTPGPFGQLGETVPPLDVIAYGPSRVIEVKLLTGQPPAWIVAALAGLREDPEFSKFRMGMRALEDGARPERASRRTRPISIPMEPVDSE
jgi:hypothetical protein